MDTRLLADATLDADPACRAHRLLPAPEERKPI
jgi:hypothetical protein